MGNIVHGQFNPNSGISKGEAVQSVMNLIRDQIAPSAVGGLTAFDDSIEVMVPPTVSLGGSITFFQHFSRLPGFIVPAIVPEPIGHLNTMDIEEESPIIYPNGLDAANMSALVVHSMEGTNRTFSRSANFYHTGNYNNFNDAPGGIWEPSATPVLWDAAPDYRDVSLYTGRAADSLKPGWGFAFGNRGIEVHQSGRKGLMNITFIVPRKDLGGNKVALVPSYTWDGTPVILSADTSDVEVGEWMRFDTDNQWFKITVIDPNVSVTVENPDSLTIPSGTGASASSRSPRTQTTLPQHGTGPNTGIRIHADGVHYKLKWVNGTGPSGALVLEDQFGVGIYEMGVAIGNFVHPMPDSSGNPARGWVIDTVLGIQQEDKKAGTALDPHLATVYPFVRNHQSKYDYRLTTDPETAVPL